MNQLLKQYEDHLCFTNKKREGFKKMGNTEGVNRMETKAAIYIKAVADIKEAIEREKSK